jgi:hypothetical protein
VVAVARRAVNEAVRTLSRGALVWCALQSVS